MTQIPILSGIEFLPSPCYTHCMANDYYVYEHIRNDTGAVFYVGKGRGRRAYIANGYHRSQWWLRVVEKAGGFTVRFLAQGISELSALQMEIDAIAQYREQGVELVNMTNGGDGTSGYKRSAELNAFFSAMHRGKVMSPEVREKISASVKASGYVPSEEARQKMSAAHKGHRRALGYRHTDEWKARASEVRKGNKSRTGQRRSDEERAKASASLSGRVQTKLTCPHCAKQGGNIMRRYHFDNCKEASFAMASA